MVGLTITGRDESHRGMGNPYMVGLTITGRDESHRGRCASLGEIHISIYGWVNDHWER